ncbi:MAG TPA: alpha/beta fold hydrolase [Candidatus Onthomonas avicola]|nr:alpha/beta fold hydrolase [Candidatus Onthomonas avicola]
MKAVFLHGLGQTSSSWGGTLRELHCGGDALCPDLKDWASEGEVDYPRLYRALEAYCAALEGLLNLCGLSLGGILALQYTIEHPDRVSALVLIGAQYRMPRGLLRLQNAVFRIMPDNAFLSMGWGKRDVIALTKSMLSLDFQSDLDKIRCPVAVLYGEKDSVNRKAALRMKERIAGAQLHVIPGAGHEVNEDAPAALARVLETFFAG